ncbi:electron transport complex subunit RsxG [Vibrio sp. ZSDZ34]|jgi:electron transport complex protein RnfG|uniref:Ion-translocating oxidoreductase complex subunit G n=1 Tax=Vibrio gelatinilyticus TaxID=2893468 RepID=A0A9X2AYY4_9VIBR|nr:electron transport complex subunit RsxG [Vibrio gelatinilyticus]MCJ2377232.1 electron transport complex subunit RsxG [Vibrio gelatinilyticus]
MLTAIRKNGLTLALFACVATGVVAVTHYLTQDKILQQQQAQLQGILNEVVPHRLHDNELYAECTLVSDPALGSSQEQPVYIATLGGQPTALAIESIAPDGYNGTIKIIVGIDMQGKILGSRVLAHQETPGLGDKIDLRVSDWILSFTGKTVSEDNLATWAVRKDGGAFDSFTGATITPRAVVKAVRDTVDFINEHRSTILTQPRTCGEF